MMKVRLFFSILWVCAAGSWAAEDEKPTGLILHEAGAFEGYNLFSPLDAAITYLIDNEGRVVHTWESDYRPANLAYLMDNGHILRPAGFGLVGNGTFHGGGAGYRIEEFTWEGEKVWEFVYASESYLMHHDVEPMPNGNVLILVWEMKTRAEAEAAGRDPELLRGDELWPESILEIKPVRPDDFEVVWEWHLWDHLIQDFDSSKANYGDVTARPERVEINPIGFWMDRISDEEREELEALGYLADAGDAEKPKPRNQSRGTGADWNHTNAIAYNAKLDQIAISVLGNSEIWVMDHSTTTEEAKGSAGDLLYRWGNPFASRLGPESNQQLFVQHNVHWIPEGRPGAGNLLIFNNGRGRPGGSYSSVVEIETPVQPDGTYAREAGAAYGPESPAWQYTAPEKKDFYSSFISGAQRLPNGNTLVCEGASGTFFEVTAKKEMVWRYVNPAVPPPDPEKDKEGSGNVRRKPGNAVFRVHRYAPDHPAFQGRNLTPGLALVDYLETRPAKRGLVLADEQE